MKNLKLDLHGDYEEVRDMLQETRGNNQGFTLIVSKETEDYVKLKVSMGGNIQHATYAATSAIDLFISVCEDLKKDGSLDTDLTILHSVELIMDDLQKLFTLIKTKKDGKQSTQHSRNNHQDW